jgi:hypothetical protein
LPVRAATSLTQTFNLHPGWNAVHLEVLPLTNSPSAVFAGVPIASLWTYAGRASSVDFIQNPDQPIANRSQWLMFLPTNRVESFQNSLHQIQGNRAYLVEVAGSAPVTLSISGTPSLRPIPWRTDAYTLRGLPVNASGAPTFASFFSGSEAHYDRVLRRLQPVYRLNATGQWQLVDAEDRIVSGEAYWVRTQGASDYPGPLEIEIPSGDAVDFGATTEVITLTLRNRSATLSEVQIEDLGGAGANGLSYSEFIALEGVVWKPLVSVETPVFRVTLAAGQSRELRLAVRRTELGAAGYASVLKFSDDSGVRRWVPVRAQLGEAALLSLSAARAGRFGRNSSNPAPGGGTAGQPASTGLAGLWFGSVIVTNVSEAHSGRLVTNVTQGIERVDISRTPTPTAQAFTLRLIVHVDTNGTARLLKEVLQMRTLPVFTTGLDGTKVETDPGRLVLVTDERLIPTLAGIALRGGQQVARRLSSADFDFPGAPERNYVEFAGSFGLGQVIQAAITIDPNFPTNPFKHKYHPDHDNLTANFREFKAEAPSVDRQLELVIGTLPQSGKADPAYGYSRVEGEYRETLRGLHREPIEVAGSFTLQRISDVGMLNQ